jgi:hypothetical protein
VCNDDLFVAKKTLSGTPDAKNFTVSVPSYQSFADLFPPVAQADNKKPKTATIAKFLILVSDIYPLKI